MKDSVYTLFYAAAMGLVAASLLAGVWTLTTPYREVNENVERVRNLMKVLGVEYDQDMSADELIAFFEKKVERRDEASGTYYLYAPDDFPEGQHRLAVRFSGSGMWGPIAGFLAIEPDLRTIAGLAVYRQEETPGLGGEIGAEWFMQQFSGRSMVDETGRPGISIVRDATRAHEVDAITGATMSSESLEKMINVTIALIVEENF